MISEKFHQSIKYYTKKLRLFVNRIWFPPLLLILAILDVFVIIIPTEGILISSSMLFKKRWFLFASVVAIGSSLGALLLIYLIEHYGLQKMLEFYPGINETKIWNLTLTFFRQYGLWPIFLMGLTPFSQQPVLAIAALSNISFLPLASVIFISRILKFCFMAYIASHAPKLLNKFWGLKNELKDSGVKL